MQLKFQQSLQYVFVKVPQIQFIVSLCEHSVLHRDGVHSANCAEDRRFHGAVLDGRRHARCCANDRVMVQTVQNCGVPQL